MSEHWQIDENKTSEHILHIEDPEGWRSAEVKWDGCIHYYRYYNTPKGMDPKNDEEEADYIHICNIDEEIAKLQALKRVAANYFSERGYCGGPWPDMVETVEAKADTRPLPNIPSK